MERLVQFSENSDQIATAFAKAQTAFTPVPKTKTAKVKGRTKAGSDYEYTYKYADLADCLSMALPHLGANGIAFSQPHVMVDGKLRVCTLLLHSSGQWMKSDGIEISEAGDPQQFGGESTYFRRYDGCSLLGIAPDEDTDGQTANQPSPKPQPKVNQVPAQPKNDPRPSEVGPVKHTIAGVAPLGHSNIARTAEGNTLTESVQKTDDLPTKDELKVIQADVREWAKKVDKEQLIAFIRKTANQEDSKLITKTQWSTIFGMLKQAEGVSIDKLKEIVGGKSE